MRHSWTAVALLLPRERRDSTSDSALPMASISLRYVPITHRIYIYVCMYVYVTVIPTKNHSEAMIPTQEWNIVSWKHLPSWILLCRCRMSLVIRSRGAVRLFSTSLRRLILMVPNDVSWSPMKPVEGSTNWWEENENAFKLESRIQKSRDKKYFSHR